ncbi:MAG: hypothetical protein JWM59_3105 [Verrucomicrobiales bacterium]|nr:hypothetical protein [Verrucomicrobiales bacterium]
MPRRLAQAKGNSEFHLLFPIPDSEASAGLRRRRAGSTPNPVARRAAAIVRKPLLLNRGWCPALFPMLPPSHDPAGSPHPPEAVPPASAEDAYWDIDSDVIQDPQQGPGPVSSAPSISAPAAAAGIFGEGPSTGEAGSAESTGSAPNPFRSLKKSQLEPPSFPSPGSNPEIPIRAGESSPVSPIERVPRPMRTDPLEKAEGSAGPSRLQRKSTVGVEIFTRQSTRPAPSLENLPAALPEPDGAAGIGPGGPASPPSAVPQFHRVRPQEVTDQAVPGGAAPRHHSSRRAARRRKRALITLLTLAVLTGAGIWIWKNQTPPPPLPESDVTPSSTASVAEKNTLSDPSLLPPLADRQEAVQLGLTSLLKAPDWQAKLPWVLHPERLSGRMKDFYLSQKGRDPEFTDVSIGPPVAWESAWWFVVSLQTPEAPPIRIAAKETPDGPRFDWENLVGYGTISFSAFCEEKPITPQTLRLRARSSDVYGGGYSSKDYKAFDLSPRTGKPVVHAYAAIGSPAVRQLEELIAAPGWNHAILSLRWESRSESPATVVIDQAQTPTLPGTAPLSQENSVKKPGGNYNKSGSSAIKARIPGGMTSDTEPPMAR